MPSLFFARAETSIGPMWMASLISALTPNRATVSCRLPNRRAPAHRSDGARRGRPALMDDLSGSPRRPSREGQWSSSRELRPGRAG